jgi:hypothetical protein
MRGVVALTLSLAVSFSVLAAQLGPDDKVLRFDSSTKVLLCTECPIQEATFQVTVLTGAERLKLASDESPAIVGVSSNGHRIANLESRFVPSWKRGNNGEPAMLVITITPPLQKPGTYDVVLNLLPKSWRRAPRETVQILLPDATLQGPSKLFIERTIQWPAAEDLKTTPLHVWETGKAAAVRSITLDSEPFAIGSTPISGRIVAVDKPKAEERLTEDAKAGVQPVTAESIDSTLQVRAGKEALLGYALKGDFPFGSASGAIRLSAPELKAPLVIPVEVRSRLSRWHLAAVIVVGLVLSWCVKVALQRRIQVSQARVAAATLLRNVDTSGYADQQFHATVNPLARVLMSAAAEGLDAKKIDDARNALDTAWRAARQEVETRRTAFRALLERWRIIVSLPWELPPEVDAAVVSGRDLRSAMAFDQQGDIGRAMASLEETQATTVGAIHKESRDWQHASRALFDRLLSSSEGVSDAILQPLKNAVSEWRIRYIEIEPAPINDPEQVEPLLRPVMGEYVAVREHLEEVVRRLLSEYLAVAPKLTAEGVQAALVTAIGVRLDSLREALTLAADEPQEVDANLDTRLQALQRAWAVAFAAAPRATPEVLSAIVARNFRGAAELLGVRSVRNESSSTGGSTASLPDAFDIRTSLPPRPSGVILDLAVLDPADPYIALLLESSSSIKKAKFLQTFIVGALFLFWATTTYGRTFDGTVMGLSTAFFSAFGLDVGLDALLGRIKS